MNEVIAAHVERMIKLGVPAVEAATMAAALFVAGASSAPAKRSSGAERTARWRDKRASQSVTNVTCDVTEIGDEKRHKASQSVTVTSPISTPSLSIGIEGKKKKERERGCKLPADWKPSLEGIQYASRQGMSAIHVDREVEKFRNHWHGEGKTKLDWDATWRNWIIRSLERSAPQVRTMVTSPSQSQTVDGVWVKRGSPQWQAWAKHRGREPFYSMHRGDEGAMFRTEWPPAEENAA